MIYHQGHFDGACFLYSVINAYSAITGKDVKQSAWEDALKWIPFRSDYMSNIGTQRIDDDFNLYKFTIKRILRELEGGENIEVIGFVTVSSEEDIKQWITESSVLLYNKQGYHWVVGVDYCSKGIEVACSSELVNNQSKYNECDTTNFARRFNSLQQFGKFGWLYKPSAMVMRRKRSP